jgi:Uma2 family endonuclease
LASNYRNANRPKNYRKNVIVGNVWEKDNNARSSYYNSQAIIVGIGSRQTITMLVTTSKSITLEEFLKLPETKPANEYIDGAIVQKPMPKGRHSSLQSELCTNINLSAKTQKIAYAFPELRCTFGDRSIVPDVAIFQWRNIPFSDEGQILDDFKLPPDWTIEILSPEQKPNKVIGNILHCLKHGCQLGWFIDPDDFNILIFLPDRPPELMQGSDRLPLLEGLDLELTVDRVFGWLLMGK